MKTKIKKCCETCQFWKLPDPSQKDIGNVGVCTWLMPHSSDFYAVNDHAPFWTSNLAFRTASFDGQSCGTYKAKQKKEK